MTSWLAIAQQVNAPGFDPATRHVSWLETIRIGLRSFKDEEMVMAHKLVDDFLRSDKGKYLKTKRRG